MSPTYRLQWRERTPKGNPGRFHNVDSLTLDDLKPHLDKALAKALWLYVEQEGVVFPGSSTKK